MSQGSGSKGVDRRLFLLFLLLLVSAVASVNQNFAAHTMPRSLYTGTALACFADIAPGMIALALAGIENVDIQGQCGPTWFRAVRYGFPTADPETLTRRVW